MACVPPRRVRSHRAGAERRFPLRHGHLVDRGRRQPSPRPPPHPSGLASQTIYGGSPGASSGSTRVYRETVPHSPGPSLPQAFKRSAPLHPISAVTGSPHAITLKLNDLASPVSEPDPKSRLRWPDWRRLPPSSVEVGRRRERRVSIHLPAPEDQGGAGDDAQNTDCCFRWTMGAVRESR
jgi:hypothetical protein